MSYILTRTSIAVPLLYQEVDSNFTNLNNSKLEINAISGVTGTITSSATTSTITSVSVNTLAVGMVVVKTAGAGVLGTLSTITAVDPTNNTITVVATTSHTLGSVTFTASPSLSGGFINNTPIGLTTASTGAFTTLTTTGNVGVGLTTTTATLHIKAGTASANTAPLKLTAGTNLSTFEAGAVEFNGSAFVISPDAAYRGVVPAVTFTSGLSAFNGGTIVAATNYAMFPTANDTITLPIGLYTFEVIYRADTSAAIANIPSWSPIGTGTAVGTVTWHAASTATPSTTLNAISVTGISAATATAFGATTSVAAQRIIQIKGLLRLTTAGTIIPAIQYSGLAGVLTTYADNYMVITPISTGISTTVTIGFS